MLTLNASLARHSVNEKTGPMPVSVTGRQSCPGPKYCALWQACYAWSGRYRGHWEKVSEGARGLQWEAFCALVAKLPAGILWRHNAAGDLPGIGPLINAEALALLVAANLGKRGYTYTHKPVIGARWVANRRAIARAIAGGFAINLSADNLAQADTKAALGLAPVCVLLPASFGAPDAPSETYTKAGRKIRLCLAYSQGKLCKDCGLCAVMNLRRDLIGFPAHGGRKAEASRIAEGACNAHA